MKSILLALLSIFSISHAYYTTLTSYADSSCTVEGLIYSVLPVCFSGELTTANATHLFMGDCDGNITAVHPLGACFNDSSYYYIASTSTSVPAIAASSYRVLGTYNSSECSASPTYVYEYLSDVCISAKKATCNLTHYIINDCNDDCSVCTSQTTGALGCLNGQYSSCSMPSLATTTGSSTSSVTTGSTNSTSIAASMGGLHSSVALYAIYTLLTVLS